MGKFSRLWVCFPVLTRCRILNPYNITQFSFPSTSPTRKVGLSIGVIAAIAIGGACLLFAILAGAFLWRRRSKKRTIVPRSHNKVYQRPPSTKTADTISNNSNTDNRKYSTESASTRTTTDRKYSTGSASTRTTNNRKYSTGSASTRKTDKSHRINSHRSTEISLSQSSSHQQVESEKARAAVEVQRVVREQLDAFRKVGYYDIPRLSRATPVTPAAIPAAMPAAMPAVELSTGDSVLGRFELFGGEPATPVMAAIEEEELHELSAEPNERLVEHLETASEGGDELSASSGEEDAEQPSTPSSNVFKAMVLDMILDRQ
jgi:hypothetical protein